MFLKKNSLRYKASLKFRNIALRLFNYFENNNNCNFYKNGEAEFLKKLCKYWKEGRKERNERNEKEKKKNKKERGRTEDKTAQHVSSASCHSSAHTNKQYQHQQEQQDVPHV